jgi:hypothetical protein
MCTLEAIPANPSSVRFGAGEGIYETSVQYLFLRSPVELSWAPDEASTVSQLGIASSHALLQVNGDGIAFLLADALPEIRIDG